MARYTIIEHETGETWDTQFNLRFSKWEKPKMEEYFMAFKFEQLSIDRRLQGNDMRVLLFVCSNMMPGGWVEVTHQFIGNKIGMSRSNISASIRRLVEYGYLEWRVRRESGRRKLRVKEHLAGKGSYAMRRSLQIDIDDNMPLVAEDAAEYKKPTA